MSKLTGEYDLYDHVMSEKTYTRKNYEVADLLECFEIFKEKTDGVIYKPMLIKNIDEFNQELVAKYKDEMLFKIIKHEEDRPNKAYKSGFKHVIWYTYKVCGKEFTAKQLNKAGGLFVYIPVNFDTLLDLAPYLSYGIAMSSSSNGKEKIYITERSLIDKEDLVAINCGYERKMTDIYRKAEAELYLDICEKYFLYKAGERKRLEPVQFVDKENGIAEAAYEIDYMHPIKYKFKDGEKHSYWTEPQLIEGDKYKISKEDIDVYLQELFNKQEVLIEYYTKYDGPRYLD